MGPDQSAEAVRYAGASLPRNGTEIVLLHVLNSVPEVLRDIEADSALLPNKLAARQWERQQRARIRDFMEMARKILLEAGFPEKTITIEIRERKEGLARDISTEACGGDYHALIVGRSGANDLSRSTLGGIAARVAANCHLPVWLIGGKPAKGKILIAMDSSDRTMSAIDHVAGVLNSGAEEIRLIHAVRGIRSVSEGYQHIFIGDYLDKLNREAAGKIQPVFDEAVDRLTVMGIASNRITSTIVTGVTNRADAILKVAEREDFGTIVLGRKGMTKSPNRGRGGSPTSLSR